MSSAKPPANHEALRYTPSMAMTEQQRADAVKVLQEKVRGRCPMCGGSAFLVTDVAHAIPQDPSGRIVLGSKTIPLVLVMCENCNYVMPFAAVPMGIVMASSAERRP